MISPESHASVLIMKTIPRRVVSVPCFLIPRSIEKITLETRSMAGRRITWKNGSLLDRYQVSLRRKGYLSHFVSKSSCYLGTWTQCCWLGSVSWGIKLFDPNVDGTDFPSCWTSKNSSLPGTGPTAVEMKGYQPLSRFSTRRLLSITGTSVTREEPTWRCRQ